MGFSGILALDTKTLACKVLGKDLRTSAKAYSVVFSEAYRRIGTCFKWAA